MFKAAGIALVSFVFISVALAKSVSVGVRDADDSPSPLDMSKAKVVKTKRTLTFTVRTFDAWSSELLTEGVPEPNYVGVQWGRKKAAHRCVEVIQRIDGQLSGTLREKCGPLPSKVSAVPTNKPNGRTLRVVVPRGAAGKVRWWRAVTSYEAVGDADCPRDPYVIPPEQWYGSCVDTTRWVGLNR